MKNMTTLLFASILLASCSKSDDEMSFEQINGRWYFFSEQRTSANGIVRIDTLNNQEAYLEFNADKSFRSTKDGSGFYEIGMDSLYINYRRYEDEDYRRFGFRYILSGDDLGLVEGNVQLNLKRL